MVTIYKKLIYDRWQFTVTCLSTDTKPTTVFLYGRDNPITNGSRLVEINTGKRYLFNGDEEEWTEVSEAAYDYANGEDF
jgi:hypothetical protein